METVITRIGIIGAGKLGITLAQLALSAGYSVMIAGSGSPKKIALTINVLTPGAHPATTEEVAQGTDVIILALPLGKFQSLPRDALRGKLVIDAMNHWWEVDGSRDSFIRPGLSSSDAVQEFLADSRVVKAFNHMGYHDLHDGHKPPDTPERKAIAVAGDDPADLQTVSAIVDALGFDPLVIGELKSGVMLEPGMPTFGANVDRAALQDLVTQAARSQSIVLA